MLSRACFMPLNNGNVILTNNYGDAAHEKDGNKSCYFSIVAKQVQYQKNENPIPITKDSCLYGDDGKKQ